MLAREQRCLWPDRGLGPVAVGGGRRRRRPELGCARGSVAAAVGGRTSERMASQFSPAWGPRLQPEPRDRRHTVAAQGEPGYLAAQSDLGSNSEFCSDSLQTNEKQY